ncbi:MAG: hypothetical protein IT289_07095 [Oligoflexia bacterium]|nr:hypothetical protein [Oligoflexia bacterium]
MKKFLSAAGLCLVLCSNGQAASYDPVPDLISAFGNSCSMGPFTQRTLNQSTALQQILQNLRDDPACTALTGAVAGFQSAVNTVNQLLQHPIVRDREGRTEAILNELLIIYNDLRDDDPMKATLGDQIVRIRLEKLELNQDIKYEQNASFYRGLQDLAFYVQTVFRNLNGAGECLSKRPNLIIQLAAQILGVTSVFLDYPLAPGTFLVGQAIESILNFIHKNSYNSGIKELQQARLVTALSCVIEGLAVNYCEARDAEVLIKAQSQPEKLLKLEDSNWPGLRLVERDIYRFNHWIQRIIAGARPSSYSSAEPKNRARMKLADLESADLDMNGILADTARELTNLSSNDPDREKKIIGKAIRGMVTVMQKFSMRVYGMSNYHGGGGLPEESPFFTTFIHDLQCGPQAYFVTGNDSAPAQTVVNGVAQCPVYSLNDLPNLSTLIQRKEMIFAKTERAIREETKFIRDTDPASVLASFEHGTQVLVSPDEVVSRIADYLKYVKQVHRQVPQETLYLIDETLSLLSNARAVLSSNLKPALKASELQKILAPLDDSAFISKRLESLANWDLNKQIQNGNISQDVSLILQLSLSDTVGTLIRVGIVEPDRMLKKDIPEAQTLTIRNLEVLQKMFKKPIEKQLEYLSKQALSGASADPSKTKALNSLCFSALALPDQKNVSKYCQGQKMASVYEKSKLNLSYSTLSSDSLDKRLCSSYDFFRKSRLYRLTQSRR